MTPVKTPSGQFRFRMIGGGLQMQIDDASAFSNILQLDEAFWAMTGIDMDSLRFDRRFLEFIDCDKDGMIHTNDVKNALEFILCYFRDFKGLISGSGEVDIDSLNPDAPNAAEIITCARLIIRNLGKNGNSITREDIEKNHSVTGNPGQNGDGVISITEKGNPEFDSIISAIMSSGRVSKDISGVDGVSLSDIESFEAAVERRVRIIEKADNDPSIMIFGDRTSQEYELFSECEPLLDGYFLNTAAGRFLSSDPGREIKKDTAADLIVTEDVRKLLETASAALPGTEDVFDFNAPLNPLHRAKLQKLAVSAAMREFIEDSKLTYSAYLRAKSVFAPYTAWKKEYDISEGLDKFESNELIAFSQSGVFDGLKKFIDEDLKYAPVIKAAEKLLKLVLFQQNMLEFLNNFVSLPDLFNTERQSRLQLGKLVMDGRHFTLTVPVKNIAEHKRIIQTSNICVMYLDLVRNVDGKSEKKLIAAAVTSGTMRSLFIGKRGVFFDTEGVIFDACIRDMVEQPVSIGEAFKAPFFRFADFLGRQTEKIFNTRSAEMQKNMTSELNKSQLAATPAVNGKPPVAVQQTSASAAGGLPMLLMGGGIGVAALGSSAAFIAKSLQNVSFATIIAVIGGILVIFGGPSVVISLIKLYRRNLSRFLESCGCAVNRPMRMSRKMGMIFTFTPRRPKGRISMLDPANIFRPAEKIIRRKRTFIALIIALVSGAVCGIAISHCAAKYIAGTEIAAKNRAEKKKVATEVESSQKNNNRSIAPEKKDIPVAKDKNKEK